MQTGAGIGTTISMLSVLSMYALFISIIIFLATRKTELAFHGIVGYLGITLISLLKTGLFASYKYISFTLGLRVLIYWTIAWYMLEYVNQILRMSSERVH